MENNSLTKEIVKAFSISIVALMLIPGVAYFFSRYVLSTYRLNRSDFYQFDLVHTTSFWLLAGSVVVLVAIIALALLAFSNRRIQYGSFVIGWRLLMLLCVVELIVQGILLAWLSFWVTAVFTGKYFPKLILLIALMVGGGVFYAILNMFKKLPKESAIDGVMLSRVDAPVLWKHIESIASKMNTAPPDHIFTGIDANFFVTESPLIVNGQKITGRTLFISIPLLRILSREEADSVLAHELNHFRGGDTRNSAALGPKLQKCDYYLYQMYENGFTRVVYYPLNFYRLMFEIALQRESRSREFMADKAAAQIVSGKALTHSLIKIAAYASYRNQVEGKLFEYDQRHEGDLGIAAKVVQGLHSYAHSHQFLDHMKQNNVPHPFDSHPLLTERMTNVDFQVGSEQFSLIVTEKPEYTWVDDIPVADNMEQQQWQIYEQNFAAEHERVLAYRYEPAGPEQIAIVLKYFPDQVFNLKKDQSVTVSYRGILSPEGDLYTWDSIQNMQYADGTLSDTLTLTLSQPEGKKKNTNIKLAGIKAQRDVLKEALGMFSHRHAVMREMQAAARKDD